VSAITAIFAALAAYLQIKLVTARYDLQRRIEGDVRHAEERIDQLRARGGPADQLAADRLREQIIRANGVVANLPAASPSPHGGDGGSNS